MEQIFGRWLEAFPNASLPNKLLRTSDAGEFLLQSNAVTARPHQRLLENRHTKCQVSSMALRRATELASSSETVGLLVTESSLLAGRIQSASRHPVVLISGVDYIANYLDESLVVLWILLDVDCVASNDRTRVLRTEEYPGPVFALSTNFSGTQLAELARAGIRPLSLDCPEAALAQLLDVAVGWSKPYVRFRERCMMWSLTPREQQVLRLSLRGVPRCSLSEILGTSENTLKSHVRGLLRKARKTNIAEVVAEIYEERVGYPSLKFHPFC